MKRLAISAVILGACSNGTVEPSLDPCEVAHALRVTPEFTTVTAEADIAARALPGGFGGLYQELGPSSNGYMVAFFEDTAFGETRKADLRKLLSCGGAFPGWAGRFLTTELFQIQIRQAQYTASELLTYLHQLDPLKSDASVWGLELDPEQNRIWIGIEDDGQRTRIEQLAAQQGVPNAALAIEGPPPTTGTEQFESLSRLVETDPSAEDPGTFGFWLEMRFTNRQDSVRYPQWCVDFDTRYFRYTLEKWDGTRWRLVKATLCASILVPPRIVAPGESLTDSIPVAGARRLNAFPGWLTARITGTYRFVGQVYRNTMTGPGGEVLTDPAATEEQVSKPFRVFNRGNY